MPPAQPDHNHIKGALNGAFIEDALAMPAHYFDREVQKRNYGRVAGYLIPKSPHPDFILWRSSCTSPKRAPDILHDQAQLIQGLLHPPPVAVVEHL